MPRESLSIKYQKDMSTTFPDGTDERGLQTTPGSAARNWGRGPIGEGLKGDAHEGNVVLRQQPDGTYKPV